MAKTPRILIVGGGYVGMYTALRLRRTLRRGEATVTVVDPSPTMTYQPFLAEVAAGWIEPRHAVVPLRKVLRGCQVVTGRVTGVVGVHPGRTTGVDTEGRRVVMVDGTVAVPYDVLVLAPGSVSRTQPVPGLAEHAVGFGTVAEAVHLRNTVLARLDQASSTTDPDRRRAALTFTVVGGGYSGVELLAELADLTRHALRHHPALDPAELRWVLVEATDRVLPEVSLPLAGRTVARLRRRGIDVRLGTRLVSAEGGRVRLSDGTEYDSGTLVWTTGVRANPLAARLGLPVDGRGRLVCDPSLRVEGLAGVWAAGDAAAVPDLTRPGELCGPSAQHAVRQAGRLARNIVATLRGQQPRAYRHAYAGSVAGLGRHQGAAEVYGIRLIGWPAWMLHRVYHLSRVPTVDRKLRVLADWTLTALLRREVVGLAALEHPRQDWEHATGEQLAGARGAA